MRFLLYRVKMFFVVFIMKIIEKIKMKLHVFGYSSEHWDTAAWYGSGGFKFYWEMSDLVDKYQKKMMTGSEEKDHVSFSIDYLNNSLKNRERLTGLCIGCSEIIKPEMAFCETGQFSYFKVIDIAAKLIARQRIEAQKRGLNQIEYIVSDLNNMSLNEDEYDLIFAQGTVHHVENLENLFKQIQKGLKKEGLFIMREYIGPNHLQFTEKQLDIVNDLLLEIPKKYRKRWNGNVKECEVNVNMKDLLKVDPSEAVRSSEIMNILERNLKIVYCAKTGGTILSPLLSEIASNFEVDKQGNAILEKLISAEMEMINKNVIESDYVYCIAKRY